jgi:hypothetical protein
VERERGQTADDYDDRSKVSRTQGFLEGWNTPRRTCAIEMLAKPARARASFVREAISETTTHRVRLRFGQLLAKASAILKIFPEEFSAAP